MSTPRRTPGGTAGRRPTRPGARGAGRRAARATARPATRVGSRTARAPRSVAGAAGRTPRAAGQRRGLTGRAAVLFLVVGALLVSAALPLRVYLAQRGQISELRAQQSATRLRVGELEAEKARLADPAYVAAEARRRLHYVLPGETAYVVIEPSPGPVSESAVRATAPWYSQVWGSVQAADQPAPPPSR